MINLICLINHILFQTFKFNLSTSLKNMRLKEQDSDNLIDKTYLCARDLNEPKYQK